MDFRAWLAGLAPRERRFLGAGAAALVLFLIVLATQTGGAPDPDDRVELAQAPAGGAPTTVATPPPAPPAGFAPAPPPPQPSPPAQGALQLYGVVSGGPGGGAAIIGPAGGSQRAVRIGRPAGGGMILKEIGPRHALLSGPSGDIRLELATPAPLSGDPAF